MQIENLPRPADQGDRWKLPLKNSGDLELCFLGVGSAFAEIHHQTNFIIVKGDVHILVDFGMTGPKALLQSCGRKPTEIEVVLPTHSHSDHVGGIECLALMNRYVARRFMNKPKLSMIIDENYQRILWDYTLRGGLEWNEAQSSQEQIIALLKDARVESDPSGMKVLCTKITEELLEEQGNYTATQLSFGDFFNVIRPTWKTHQPREIYEVQIGDLHLEIFRTNHIPEQSKGWEASFISYGVMIDNRVFVSGDTQFDRELIDMYADQSEVMFHDVQFFPGAVHAPLDDLKGLPRDIKEKMILMHYADNWKQQKIHDFAGWAQQGKRYIFGQEANV